MVAKGTLIPIGGNEDKGVNGDEKYTLEFVEEGILWQVVNEAGGIEAKLVVIPTASSIPVEVGEMYLDAFGKLGCTNVTVLDIRSREDSELEASIDLIKAADGVVFSGGDQSKISDKIGGTIIQDILLERFQKEEGFVIAGTSAGAMMMSKEMIAGGSATDSFLKGAVKMYHGLGLVPELIIDTHFIQRGRFGRVCEAVAKFPNLSGIGLAEDTGLIIKNGCECTVIGSGMVIVFDPSNVSHNNEKILSEGTPMTMVDLKVHILSNSDSFNIKTKKITPLPIGSEFIK